MQRRGGSAGPVKGGGRKAATSKARKAPVTPVSTADLQEQVASIWQLRGIEVPLKLLSISDEVIE